MTIEIGNENETIEYAKIIWREDFRILSLQPFPHPVIFNRKENLIRTHFSL